MRALCVVRQPGGENIPREVKYALQFAGGSNLLHHGTLWESPAKHRSLSAFGGMLLNYLPATQILRGYLAGLETRQNMYS